MNLSCSCQKQARIHPMMKFNKLSISRQNDNHERHVSLQNYSVSNWYIFVLYPKVKIFFFPNAVLVSFFAFFFLYIENSWTHSNKHFILISIKIENARKKKYKIPNEKKAIYRTRHLNHFKLNHIKWKSTFCTCLSFKIVPIYFFLCIFHFLNFSLFLTLTPFSCCCIINFMWLS